MTPAQKLRIAADLYEAGIQPRAAVSSLNELLAKRHASDCKGAIPIAADGSRPHRLHELHRVASRPMEQ